MVNVLIKNISLIFFGVLLLQSCTFRYPQPQPSKIERTPTTSQTIPSETKLLSPMSQPKPSNIKLPTLTSLPSVKKKPLPQKLKSIDWLVVLSPMVKEMLKVEGIENGSMLLISTMKNDTNGDLQIVEATEILTRLIMNAGDKFQVVESDKLTKARKKLGMPDDDNLHSCRKAVAIGRHLDAQYLLYNIALGDVKQPVVNLKLMFVKTGEIIWAGKSEVIRQDVTTPKNVIPIPKTLR